MNIQRCIVRVESLGCRINQAEAEAFASLCIDAGFSVCTADSDRFCSGIPLKQTASAAVPHDFCIAAPSFSGSIGEDTVLCLVNTCTVTGKAEQKARRLLRLLVKAHPHAVILVTGCYAQLNAADIEALHPHIISFPGQQKDLLTSVPAFLAGLLEKSAYFDTLLFLTGLREYLTDCLKQNAKPDGTTPAEAQTIQAVSSAENTAFFGLNASRFLFHSRALLKIQDGCNEACAYCRIRLARGKSVSLPASEVIDRIKRIEATGVAELTLSGVNLSQYRSNAGDFAGLLELILQHTHIRLRISSLYPDRIDAALIPLLAHPRICPHFHLSVQSGSNRILKAMHRSYLRETVYHATAELRRVKENPFIGADIITGFPGETEQDFEETYRMCKNLRFAGIHAFPFSARPGTEAWKMQPKVPERIAGARTKKLNELAAIQSAAYRASWDGKELYGVIEAPRQEACTVVTENYLSFPLTGTETAPLPRLRGGEYALVRICGDHAELRWLSNFADKASSKS